MPQRRPVEDRFFEKVKFVDIWYDDGVTRTRCLHWKRALTAGYGAFWPGPETGNVLAHRWLYERWIGPIPDGMELDHDCHNRDTSCAGGDQCVHRRCVNPLHMIVSSSGENSARSVNNVNNRRKALTRCKRGHLFEGDNLYLDAGGYRRCRACLRLLRSEYHDRMLAKYGRNYRSNPEYRRRSEDQP